MSRKTFQIGLILYIFTILAVSTIPGGVIPKINIWSFDKILHIIEYFILAFFAINAIKKPSLGIIILIIIVGFAYGVFNEIWQGMVADRFVSVYDAIANGIGMIIGSIISYKYLLLTHD
jgi:VanZ family protein